MGELPWLAGLFLNNIHQYDNDYSKDLVELDWEKATKFQSDQNQYTLDKSIGTACDVVQPELHAGCCAPLKVLYIIGWHFFNCHFSKLAKKPFRV